MYLERDMAKKRGRERLVDLSQRAGEAIHSHRISVEMEIRVLILRRTRSELYLSMSRLYQGMKEFISLRHEPRSSSSCMITILMLLLAVTSLLLLPLISFQISSVAIN